MKSLFCYLLFWTAKEQSGESNGVAFEITEALTVLEVAPGLDREV